MFKIHEIREIIKLIDQSSIKEFELEIEGSKVTIKKSGGVVEEKVQTIVAQAPAAPVAAAPAPAAQAAPVQPAAQPAANTQVPEENLHQILSPMVGTFYSAPEPGASAFVQVGDKVTPNKVVCIVEAMKLFNEIEAEVTGEIVKVLVQDGQLVEYGQPLFLVKPE
ncbi:acetyl-CoA carboxylase biotin carboxyl carrier protein [Brevibacillus fulvus]|uniref:Biotin carboxyl carrier protein of acetyl-CoA carboxylase n=1 Tax=Brevibacillus fulvus TaxID=1125967 RepID=A0A938XV80_9BACL|nr:acetyl-CoA carboxylase biotin carboxyl carrier protein [Brevibacillus fulvus]